MSCSAEAAGIYKMNIGISRITQSLPETTPEKKVGKLEYFAAPAKGPFHFGQVSLVT